MQKWAVDAEQETAKAFRQIDKLKRTHKNEVSVNTLLEESRQPKEAIEPAYNYDAVELHSESEYNKCEDGELSKLAEPEPSLWFSGYDRCNI